MKCTSSQGKATIQPPGSDPALDCHTCGSQRGSQVCCLLQGRSCGALGWEAGGYGAWARVQQVASQEQLGLTPAFSEQQKAGQWLSGAAGVVVAQPEELA